MKYKLKAYSIWDCGKRVDAEGKPHQEDSMFPSHGMATDADRLFILCDGMGGHEAGEVASATVCDAMSKSILSAIPDPEGNFDAEIFHKALNDAFVALDAKDNGTSVKKMGTTMTLLKLHSEGCFIAHMGDSRVYHIRPGKTREETQIIFRTEDHSLVNELVRLGELTPEEARLSSQKNVITRAMQPNMERRPRADIHTSSDIQPGDYFYLCSDGMLENMEDEQLCYFFSEEAGADQQKVESLLKATQENRDNHSAILVHILDVTDPIAVAPPPVAKTTPLMGEVHDAEQEEEETTEAPSSQIIIPIDKPKRKKRKHFIVTVSLVLVLLVALALCYIMIHKRWKPLNPPEGPTIEQPNDSSNMVNGTSSQSQNDSVN